MLTRMIFVRKCPFNFIRRKDIFRIFCPTSLEVDDSSHHFLHYDTYRNYSLSESPYKTQ